jgi:cysteinyl-tRNA synthetase
MHNGTVMVDGVKMSKSLGNFKTIHDEVERFGASLLRFWVVASHYRSPIDYTDASVRDAGRALERLQIALQGVERYLALPAGADDAAAAVELTAQTETARSGFLAGMDDDFNTPSALAALFVLATEMNRLTGAARGRSDAGAAAAAAARDLMLELTGVLGLDLAPAAGATENDVVAPLMDLLLAARQALRKNKDFAAADELRNGLKAAGIVVEDRPEGSTWRFGGG